MSKYYICDKDNNEKIYGYLDYNNISGFKIKPRNNIKYDGVEVSKLTLVEPSLIEKVLKRKTKRQLNAYLNFLITLLSEEDTDPGDLGLVLDDTVKYKSIIVNKYAKFLDSKYIKELLARVKFVEDELKDKINEYNKSYETSKGKGR